ncbi:MAG: hypothetical protein WB438_00385 [Candidatus Cybelea sp.]
MIGRVARVSGACMLLLFGGCSGYFSRSIPATGGGEHEAARRIVFHVVDAEGKRIDWSAFRQLEENGPAGYRNDALLDSATLMLTRTGPLFSSNGMGDGDPSLTLPRGASSLSLAWPASDGYSNLIVALPANGGRTTSTSWPPRKCSTISALASSSDRGTIPERGSPDSTVWRRSITLDSATRDRSTSACAPR